MALPPQPAPPAGQGLPPGLLLSFYGDDFTGSTDAMEALAAAGLPTLLCLKPPTPALLARRPGLRCVGLAGDARGRDPAWMARELPGAFACLAALGAPLLHYKVCSTFDSSPALGSIGCAIDLGLRQVPGHWVPLILGVPALRRYQLFGHLFAAVEGRGYRLDRHPTMSRHPVTPMDESDVCLHLARQTARRIELLDMVQLRQGLAATRLQTLLQVPAGQEAPVVALDVLDDETLLAAGQLVWETRGPGLFCAASSGLQYALVAYWRSRGWLPPAHVLPRAAEVDAVAAVSGSCSPGTAAQLRRARAQGFHVERLQLPQALDPAMRAAEVARAVAVAVAALRQGRSPIVHSAEGPDDPAVRGFDATARAVGLTRAQAAREVGGVLAEVLRGILACVPVPRVVVAGGDSAGEVAGALGIDALEVAAGLAPGAPLCSVHAADPAREGLQLVLKGGQVGGEFFFSDVRAGGPTASGH